MGVHANANALGRDPSFARCTDATPLLLRVRYPLPMPPDPHPHPHLTAIPILPPTPNPIPTAIPISTPNPQPHHPLSSNTYA